MFCCYQNQKPVTIGEECCHNVAVKWRMISKIEGRRDREYGMEWNTYWRHVVIHSFLSSFCFNSFFRNKSLPLLSSFSIHWISLLSLYLLLCSSTRSVCSFPLYFHTDQNTNFTRMSKVGYAIDKSVGILYVAGISRKLDNENRTKGKKRTFNSPWTRTRNIVLATRTPGSYSIRYIELRKGEKIRAKCQNNQENVVPLIHLPQSLIII